MMVPREYLHEYVMRLQNMLTINIVSGDLSIEFLEEIVKSLDILHFANKQKHQNEMISE